MSLPSNELVVTGGTPAPAALPDAFGRFRIIRTLAFGGMAQILLAEEARTGRLVVLKRILPHYASNPEFVQFFIHEGRLGQRLRHKNLVETIEAGQVGDACYIALEYLRGQPAIELLRAAARARVELPLGAAVRIVADAARGLHHAHTAVDGEGRPLNVVHRDVTPHNLFLCLDGTTKVLDFGIAKAASQLHHTRTGTIKGKFAYLAPEQIKGQGIDRRVDVFALGIVLHELLTLRPLFRGTNDAETLNRVLTMEVPAPEHVRRGVPPGLGAVALRALQRDRDRRLPSAEALADSIEAVAEAEGIDASPRVVAELLAELCPADEAVLRETTPPNGNEPLDVPATSASGSASIVEDPPTELARPSEPIIPLEHPKAVPALLLSDADPRSSERRLAGRVALFVVAVGVLAAAATQVGSCAARFGHSQALSPSSRMAEVARPSGPAVKPILPPLDIPSPAPIGVPRAQPTVLVPAGAPSSEALLHVQVEGPASFVVDGRSERPGPDGALHLVPGHHRVTVTAATLATPHTLEVDLRARESATRQIPRGHGQLRVAVTPWAEVTVDGRVVGVTPLAPLELAEGAHQVALKNNDLGVVARRRIVVSPSHETLLKLDLFGERK